MELYIIRHGTTDWNAQRRFQGMTDIELNQNGRELAGKLGGRLEDVPFDKIYSSPLIRAYETACLIRGHRPIQIIRDERLRELGFGTLEGLPYKKWIETDSPRKYFFTAPEKYEPPEGGETLESLCARTADFARTVLEPQAHTAQRLMVVAHGALLAALCCHLDSHGIDRFWGNGLKDNCEETVYNFDGVRWTKVAEDAPCENPYEEGQK